MDHTVKIIAFKTGLLIARQQMRQHNIDSQINAEKLYEPAYRWLNAALFAGAETVGRLMYAHVPPPSMTGLFI